MAKKKQAQWIRVRIGNDDGSFDEYFMCSSCDMKWFLATGDPIQNEMFYCPRCGKKMAEEVE